MPTLSDYRMAYRKLLQVTAEPDRTLYCQHALALLRDTIAELEGVSPEVIQNSFESKAALATLQQVLNAN